MLIYGPIVHLVVPAQCLAIAVAVDVVLPNPCVGWMCTNATKVEGISAAGTAKRRMKLAPVGKVGCVLNLAVHRGRKDCFVRADGIGILRNLGQARIGQERLCLSDAASVIVELQAGYEECLHRLQDQSIP